MQLRSGDPHDDELTRQVHPSDWQNPTPSGTYNLVALGGGTAGLVAAIGTARLGGRAALVEKHLLGGDCLNFGCVPSKALLRSAHAAQEMRRAGELGYRGPHGTWDFAAVSERVRRLRAEIGRHDSAARLAAEGVDLYIGSAAFTSPDRVNVAGQSLRFRRAVIATGARPVVPAIDGLAESGYQTNETIFSLTELPRTLVVVGAGPLGCELGQAFRRLGSDVHLINDTDRVLPKEDPEVGEALRTALAADGMHLHLGWHVLRVERLEAGKALLIARGEQKQQLIADEILVAVGRRPNLESLDLPAAGIRTDDRGVVLNDYLQTTNRRVYAAGDVCAAAQYTHAAYAMARLVLRNALFLGRRRASRLAIPRCTYTDPEIAHVGLTATEAQAPGVAIDSHRVTLGHVDRAILEGRTEGFAVVHTRRGTARIVGATIVAPHAGEMIALVTLALERRLPLSALGDMIHCYPTRGELLKQVADQYEFTRLTPRAARFLKTWLAWRR